MLNFVSTKSQEAQTVRMDGMRYATRLRLGVLVASVFISSAPSEASEHQGYKFLRKNGLAKATCVIEFLDPVTTTQTMAWVGLDNNYKDNKWIFLQAGWIDYPLGLTVPEMYYEYFKEDGSYSGIIVSGAPSSAATYGVRLSGQNYELVVGGAVTSFPWVDFNAHPLCGAQFGVELYGSNDQTPGTVSNPCDFSSAVIQLVGGSDITAPFTSCGLVGDNLILIGLPNSRSSTSANGSFITWDARYP